MRPVAVLVVFLLAAAALDAGGCSSGPDVDLILRGGTLYDGSGEPGRVGDVAIRGDSIVAVGDVRGLTAARELDVRGLAVAPGFVDMLSRAGASLLEDGTAEGDVLQGVTLEVLGGGETMAPPTDSMRAARRGRGASSWTALGEYLDTLARRGVAPNVASFVGATTVRVHELGWADRPPTDAELARMRELVREAMDEGAMGVSADLGRAPGSYAGTPELVALAKVAAQHGGVFMSSPRHGESALEAVDELIDIARESGAAAEVYGLGSAGSASVDSALQEVDSARSQGIRLEADVVPGPHAGGGLGLTAAKDVVGEIRWPWVDFGSGAAPAPTIRAGEAGHPAYGTFARVLGTWVRDERVLTLADAVRRMTSLPAEMLGLRRRGRLASGYYADVAVFDSSAIADSATSGKPAPALAGMVDVFVDGVQVVRDGVPTGAKPGEVVRGPGWTG